MRCIVLGGALLLAGAPAIAAPKEAAPPPIVSITTAPPKDSPAKAKKDNFDFAKMMAMFDKIFPPQPEPESARLALSRTSVRALFPDGTYARLMGGMMKSVSERFMSLSEADFGKADKGKPASTMTMRDQMKKNDPYFDERMKIYERVIGDELGKLALIIEPKLREGLARSMARRFDAKQLTEINAFLATDTGKAFGSQSLAMWVDPDVMRSMMQSMPEMMMAMPDVMKRLDAETAHLPKPKKPAKTDAAQPKK
jgi:hypothetical protein